MPIASFDEEEINEKPIIETPITNNTDDVQIKNTLVDKPTTTPWVDSLAGYKAENNFFEIGGKGITIDYYQQNREAGDISDNISTDVDSAYQQYAKINGFVLKLSSDISYSTDDITKEITLSGDGFIADTLVPNKGDHFTYERNVGYKSLFVITSTRRLSPFNGSGYNVTFTMIEETSINKLGAKVRELESKVTNTWIYERNYIHLNTKPLLTKNELHDIVKRKRMVSELTNDYLRRFYDKQIQTLTFRDKNLDIILYDPYLSKFVVNHLENSSNILLFNDRDETFYSVLDAISGRKPINKYGVMNHVIFANTLRHRRLQYLYAIHYTDVNCIVRDSRIISPDMHVENMLGSDLNNTMERSPINKLFPYLNKEGSYIFSEAFYNGETENLTKIEMLVNSWLNNRNMDLDTLNEIVDVIPDMTDVERFYLTPIIILFLKYS